jgi:TorA maturation chaperone TorD
MTTSDPGTLLAAAATCRLAARTFAAEVDPPFHRALLRLCRAPRLAAMGLAPLDDNLRALPPAQVLEELAVEYCRLFVGPNPLCPPYATARPGGGALGTHTQQALRRFLHDHGLEPRLPAGAPVAADDHIAVAFAVLDRLYTAAAGGPDTPLDQRTARTAVRQFREDYLMTWAPDLLHEVCTHARCGPYGPIARVTLLLLQDPHLHPTPAPPGRSTRDA